MVDLKTNIDYQHAIQFEKDKSTDQNDAMNDGMNNVTRTNMMEEKSQKKKYAVMELKNTEKKKKKKRQEIPYMNKTREFKEREKAHSRKTTIKQRNTLNKK